MNIEKVHARSEIFDTLCRYARAIDRMDKELLSSCYFEDAVDEHIPFFVGPAPEFIEWVMKSLAKLSFSRHEICNVVIDLRGDEAGVESYWNARLRAATPTGEVDIIRGGRYLDVFRPDGDRWKIARRRSLPEFSVTYPVTSKDLGIPVYETRPELAAIKGARDRSDPSYEILM